jgi:hypothetical protein
MEGFARSVPLSATQKVNSEAVEADFTKGRLGRPRVWYNQATLLEVGDEIRRVSVGLCVWLVWHRTHQI